MNTPKVLTSSGQQTAAPELRSDREQIEQRAYYGYVERGRADGAALDDWLKAEEEIRQSGKGLVAS